MFCIKHNFYLRKEKMSTDSFVCEDPRVYEYEPVGYEMLVDKENYAFKILI